MNESDAALTLISCLKHAVEMDIKLVKSPLEF